MQTDIATRLLAQLLAHPRVKGLLSQEHFSVDGTLIEAWASMKSFVPIDGGDQDGADSPGGRNPDVNFRGKRRSFVIWAMLSWRTAMVWRSVRL